MHYVYDASMSINHGAGQSRAVHEPADTPATKPVIDLLKDLVRIPSVNPAYADGRSEAGMVEFIEKYFRRYSIETERQEALPGRPNLVARLPGKNLARRLIFEAHTDTVSAGGMEIPPFEPVVRNGRLYGRGSSDTKAGLAAMISALVSLKLSGTAPPCEIWVVAAADEENAYAGVRRLLERDRASAAVVSEPTGMRIASAGKGVLRWRIHCRGKAAHSAMPHLGINAITNMAHVILALDREHERLQAAPHPLLGPATLNVGIIQGGRQVNMVPDDCSIDLDRRLLPGERIGEVLEHTKKLLDGSLDVQFEAPSIEDEAFETAADSAIVRCAMQSANLCGLSSELVGVPFGSDASKFFRAGIPSIVCGPGSIDQAHTSAEYVECSQVELAARFYRQLMLDFA